MDNWKDAFTARTDLEKYGHNALGLFALALKFGVEDLETAATESITDGRDDKKCDIVFINNDEEYAVIAQCYMSQKEKDSAPSNKASDLNTAVTWLIQRELADLPKRILPAAQELRKGIEEGTIKSIYLWYVHNLPESKNCEDELDTVQQTAISALKHIYKNKKVNVYAYEVGKNRLEEWYSETLSPILVNEEISISYDGGYFIESNGWKAISTSIPARLLYRLFRKHKTKLFSANIRDYLGSRSTDSNINNGIKKTIENDPSNFWAFNNGITVLTHRFKIPKQVNGKLSVKGFSIVNGAQTTGAIGSLRKLPDKQAKVHARFIEITNNDSELIRKIIQFNNSQNKVEASDFRSTDKIQRRLKREMQVIPDAEYEGGRRGGIGDAIRRRPKLLPSYTVGQALAAFHGDPIVAYNKKRYIWIDDRLYSRFFNEQTKAAHLVCAYSLLRAVEAKKKSLIDKEKKSETSLTQSDIEQINYFRKRGSTYLFVAAIANCLEVILGRKVPNLFRISFGNDVSPLDAQGYWNEIIAITVPFCGNLENALIGGLNSSKKVADAISTFRSLVQATESINKPIFEKFKKKIKAP